MAKHENKDVHTMIGADAVIQGNIICQGGVAVYGKVFGDVTSEGPVRVARGGEVHGNVQADDSNIGGTVDGNVRVENRAVLGSEISTKRRSNLSYAGNRGRGPVSKVIVC